MGYTPYAPCRWPVGCLVKGFMQYGLEISVAPNGYRSSHSTDDKRNLGATTGATAFLRLPKPKMPVPASTLTGLGSPYFFALHQEVLLPPCLNT